MKNYTNYHGELSFKGKLIFDGTKIFKRSLKESPDSYTVEVNNKNINILLQSTSDYNKRRILFKHDDIKWGDIVIINNDKWLVTEYPFYNTLYDKTKISLCNNSMVFETKTDGYYEEKDRFGNPIWIREPKIVERDFPCVVKSISDLETEVGGKINLPQGDMVLQISYTTDNLISNQSEFKMFDDLDYKITGIDRSKVYDNKGVLTLIVSRTT